MVYSPYICSQFVVTMALAPQRPGMVFILKNVHWKIRNFCLLEFNQRLITRKNTLNLTYRKICPLTEYINVGIQFQLFRILGS